jgi:3-deoxy-7-phosphoheptulonate synthase
MLVVLERGASERDAEPVVAAAARLGCHAQVIGRDGAFAVAVTGGARVTPAATFRALARVARVIETANPYFLAGRLFRPEDTIVDVSGVPIGGPRVVVMAGPCAIENVDQLNACAERMKKSGVEILRAGAYKPRTSPWSFQGLQAEGIKLLAEVKASTGLRVVTEVVSEGTLEAVAEVADLVQVGARNMKNYELLKAAGRCRRPVLLKRGAEALVSELLLAAEYLLAAGSPGVILCERGIRTFADHARHTLDLSAVPALERLSHLPVMVDPSHGTGQRDLVLPLARAAVAVGADGLLVEVHPRPEEALSDGPQALRFEDFDRLMLEARAVAQAIGRSL